MSQYDIPKELYYTYDHAWVKVEGPNIRIGVTDFMQKLAGEITFIRVPRAGKSLTAGAMLSTIQSGKWAGKIKAPLDGKVLEVNNILTETPNLLNDDCYGGAWICVMEASDLASGLAKLIPGEAAEKFFAQEHDKYVKE